MNKSKFAAINAPALWLIVLVAVAIRLVYLTQPMRYDEALTFLHYASQPLSIALSSYAEPNNHVFHTLLVHLTTLGLGNQPWIIRLPAFIAGIALIPALYWTTRKFYNERAGLLAALLGTVSLTLIEFSANARGYTLITLIFTLLLGVAFNAKRRNERRSWVLFSVLAALGFYTIPVMLYPMGVVALWLLITIWRDAHGDERWSRLFNLFLSLLLGAVLTFVLYLPIIGNEGLDALTGNEFVTAASGVAFYTTLGRAFSLLLEFINRGYAPFVQALLGLGVIVSLLFHRRLSRERLPLLFAAVLWLLPVLFFQRVVPFDRTWIFLIPLYLMLASAGLAFLVRDDVLFYGGGLALSLFIGVNVVQSREVYTSPLTGLAPDAEAVALHLISTLAEDDSVLIPIPLDEPVRYYLDYHGYPRDPITNEYETHWADLLQSYGRSIYVVSAPSSDVAAFQDALYLPEPPFDVGLSTVHQFPQHELQRLRLPTLPRGILFSDDFEGELSLGWNFGEANPQVVTFEDSHVLYLQTESWQEVTLDGGADWRDYTLQLSLHFSDTSAINEDMALHIRNNYDVGSYAVALNPQDDRASIGGDQNRAWRGYLAEGSYPLETERWYTVSIQAIGEAISVFIDGALVVSTRDNLAERGTFRIVLPPDVQVYIDNVIVRDLSDDERVSR